MIEKIHYTKPSITELEIEWATKAAATGWGERCYDCITDFEERFKQHLGVKYAHATSSCTGATHLGLAALGITTGDEVILADINWIAVASPITYLGAKPVFVDVLPDTWCLDPAKVEEAITPKTKAIVAVHVYGNLCDMRRLREIADRHGLWLPGSRIPVAPESYLREVRPDYVVLFPWNIRDELESQLAYIRDWGGKFVTAVPELKVL